MSFAPRYNYSDALVNNLGVIEAAKALIEVLPLPPDTLLRLRHDALQRSTRSSTQIEGNPLDEGAVRQAIAAGDRQGTKAEQEVRNYWRALDRVEDYSETKTPITEAFIQELHSIVIVRERGRRGNRSELVTWLSSQKNQALPAPMRAAILSHRFLSIHPFGDGNGRTSRLLATAELWRSSYRMRGFFSFDEYFNADRDRYYRHLQMELPIDFYEGRHDPDHTSWVEYFVETMTQAAQDLQAKAIALLVNVFEGMLCRNLGCLS
jgi:Fic family protein